jgi:hypothetical protein
MITEYEYRGKSLNFQNAVELISSDLRKDKPDVYEFDIATFLLIAELVIKLIQWFKEYRNFKQDNLTLLQRMTLWTTIKFGGLSRKGAKYSEILDSVFKHIKEEDFNDFKARESV